MRLSAWQLRSRGKARALSVCTAPGPPSPLSLRYASIIHSTPSPNTHAHIMSAEPYDPYVPAGGAPASSGAGNTRTHEIQAQIDDTVGVMRQNLQRVAERGEGLDDLQGKTGEWECAEHASAASMSGRARQWRRPRAREKLHEHDGPSAMDGGQALKEWIREYCARQGRQGEPLTVREGASR